MLDVPAWRWSAVETRGRDPAAAPIYGAPARRGPAAQRHGAEGAR